MMLNINDLSVKYSNFSYYFCHCDTALLSEPETASSKVKQIPQTDTCSFFLCSAGL